MNNVLQILKEHKQDLMEKYPIKSLALFGSYSRGDYDENSDIDIMVELTEPAAMDLFKCLMSSKIFCKRRSISFLRTALSRGI